MKDHLETLKFSDILQCINCEQKSCLCCLPKKFRYSRLIFASIEENSFLCLSCRGIYNRGKPCKLVTIPVREMDIR